MEILLSFGEVNGGTVSAETDGHAGVPDLSDIEVFVFPEQLGFFHHHTRGWPDIVSQQLGAY
jgi:hypothetical protein